MPLHQKTFDQRLTQRGVGISKPKKIRNRRSLQPNLTRGISLRQTVLIHQTGNAVSPLQHVQVFTLKVFNQRPLSGCLIINRTNNGWDLCLVEQLKGTPTTLARHQLKPRSARTNNNGLHQSSGSNRRGQFRQRLFIKPLPGLTSIRDHILDLEHPDARAARNNSGGFYWWCCCRLHLRRRSPRWRRVHRHGRPHETPETTTKTSTC